MTSPGTLPAISLSSPLTFPGQRFADVPPNHWAAWAVNNMANGGVLAGFPDGQFRGDQPTTRYQLAAALNQLTNSADQGRLPMVSRAELNALKSRVTRLEQAQPQRQWLA